MKRKKLLRYKALDTKLGRTVVVKVLPEELTVRAAQHGAAHAPPLDLADSSSTEEGKEKNRRVDAWLQR